MGLRALSLNQRAAAYEVLQEAHLRSLQPVEILIDSSVDPRLATDAVDLPRLQPTCWNDVGDANGAAHWLEQCAMGDRIPVADGATARGKTWHWLTVDPSQIEESVFLERLQSIHFENLLLVSDRPWQPVTLELHQALESLEAVSSPQPGLTILSLVASPVAPSIAAQMSDQTLSQINLNQSSLSSDTPLVLGRSPSSPQPQPSVNVIPPSLPPKRILVISNLYPPQELGGYGRSIADFAAGLGRNGHTIQVLTSDSTYLGEISKPEPSVDRGLQLFGTYDGGTTAFEDQQQILDVLRHNHQLLSQAIATFQPDLCLVGNIAFLGSMIFQPLLERNIPIIHHLGFASPPYSLPEYPKHPLYHLAMASDYVRDCLVAQQFPVQDSITVYPSALVREFYQPTLPTRDRLRIGYAGLVIMSKGVHILLEALHQLQRQGIDFECAIAGDAIHADYKEELDRYIQAADLGDRVTFVGLLNRQELIQFHRCHNVLVFPSIMEEAFGITQVEAMAAGLTLITSAIGGAKEVVENGISGLTVAPNNSASLVQALTYLVQNPTQWEAIAQQGQKRALEKFDIRRSVAQLELQFQKLLEQAASMSPASSSPALLSSSAINPKASFRSWSPIPSPPPSSRFMTWLIDQLQSCLNVYKQSPQDGSTIAILREMRKQVAQFWLNSPADALETLYNSPLGTAYQQFLHSGFQQNPLTDEEQQLLQGLTQTVAQGLEQPGAINALLGVMLYFPADRMQVRDAENRLPAWLLPDYQQCFVGATSSSAATPAIAQPAPSPVLPPDAKPLWDDAFLNQLLGSANLYSANPTDPKVINRCRETRQAIARLWLQVPAANLEQVYKGPLGQNYLAFLKSGFHRAPLLEPEQSCLKELSEAVKQGFDSPFGLQSLLGVMLHLPPGTMQVRDAANRLPAWLLSDYQTVFETESQPQTTPSIPSPNVNVAPPQDMTFLNRLLGCLNLYEIDPSDPAIIENLRGLRQQIAQTWLDTAPQDLEAVFSGEFGRRYCTFLKSGFHREPLTAEESTFRQQLAEKISTGIEHPPGLKALLGGMLYFAPGSMKVSNAEQRLPQWLLLDYKAIFES
ncbi:MAG: glycosyltransferase family 4 protein [Cyanobacteria bacterium P01_D01_bin.73]